MYQVTSGYIRCAGDVSKNRGQGELYRFDLDISLRFIAVFTTVFTAVLAVYCNFLQTYVKYRYLKTTRGQTGVGSVMIVLLVKNLTRIVCIPCDCT